MNIHFGGATIENRFSDKIIMIIKKVNNNKRNQIYIMSTVNRDLVKVREIHTQNTRTHTNGI